MRSDCFDSQGMPPPRLWACVVLLLAMFIPAVSGAQAHPPAQPATHGSADSQAAHGETAEGEHAEGILPLIAKVINFAVMAGVLVYFLKAPVTNYLASRGVAIRQDLVSASDMRAAASHQLAEIDRKLKSLPAELEALKQRGAEDVRAEQARITAAAAAERQRLLEQTRREIDMRLRIARRELIELGAQLAVDVAEQRIKRAITPEDQLRLVDRYTHQLEAVR
jgi:F-type H+-transporting ATPase subunit b